MPVKTAVKPKKSATLDPIHNIKIFGQTMPKKIYLLNVSDSGDNSVGWADTPDADGNFVEYVRADLADASGVISSKASRKLKG